MIKKKINGMTIVLGVTVISFLSLIGISQVKTHANSIPILEEVREEFNVKKLIEERNQEELAPIDRILVLDVIEELKDDINLDRTDVKNTNATIWYTMDKLFNVDYIEFLKDESLLTKTSVEMDLFKYDPEYVEFVQSKVDEWLNEMGGNFLNSRPFRNIDQRVWNGHYYVFFYDDNTYIDDELITDRYTKEEVIEDTKEEEVNVKNIPMVKNNENVPQPTNLSNVVHSITHPNIVFDVSTKVVEKFNETRTQLHNAISVKAPNLVGIVDALIDNYENYGLSPYFQLAVFSLESAYGTSKLAREKNNIAGLNAYATATKSVYQNAFSFASKSDCVIRFGKIMASKTYLGRGLYTLNQIASVYCPPEMYSWSNQVSSLIDEYKALTKSM